MKVLFIYDYCLVFLKLILKPSCCLSRKNSP